MMILTHNYFNQTAQQAMLALARSHPDSNLHVHDLPYRFSSWAFDDPENIGLWVDDAGQLLAWAVMQTPFWTIDCACHPAAETILFPEILDWANRRAREASQTPFGRLEQQVNRPHRALMLRKAVTYLPARLQQRIREKA